jgi:tRNA A37 methylthiotransferase MiaB
MLDGLVPVESSSRSKSYEDSPYWKDDIKRKTGQDKAIKTCLPRKRFNPYIHILQICEGCLGKCSYCCTRFARGNLQSYPTTILKREAEQAVADSCKEIQLTAQDTAAYGKDSGEKLSDLINHVTSIPGNFKVRVGMMHPKNAEDDLESIINSFKNEMVYKFLHYHCRVEITRSIRYEPRALC